MAFRRATTFIILLDEAIFNVFCICWRIVYFWLSCRLSDASSADQPRKTCGPSRRNLFRSMIQVQLISPAIATTQSCKVHKTGNLQANIKGYSKNFYFPAEKLTKNTRALLFSFDSVGKIFANLLNFPAKRLRKNTAPKIRMRQFFKNLITKLAVFSI